VTSPKKNGLNGTMPALTKSRFGSSAINEADGTTVCFKPCSFSDSKKRSQRERISADSTVTDHSAFVFLVLRFFEAPAALISAPAILRAGPPLSTKLEVASDALVEIFSTFLVILLKLSSGPFTRVTV
jgi:hypothetical protein